VDAHAALSLAIVTQSEVNAAGLGTRNARRAAQDASDVLRLYDSLIDSDSIRVATRKLFHDGHYARAVEEAFKCLNNAVKEKSGLPSKDGAPLMREAFSANAPALKLNDMRSTSQRDEQQGYMDVYAGAMTGIRNPRAHDHWRDDEPDVALELLVLANHLMRVLAGTKRVRRRRPSLKP
jgi:uncharacterized protein (TIGR02391 family)